MTQLSIAWLVNINSSTSQKNERCEAPGYLLTLKYNNYLHGQIVSQMEGKVIKLKTLS